jgi:hypothetical protein
LPVRCSAGIPRIADPAMHEDRLMSNTQRTLGGAARWIAILAIVLGAGTLLTGAAAGSSGVSIDVGTIAVSEQLVPGGDYRLPTFGVRNPGTEATTYRLMVTYIDGSQAMPPPQSWFTFSPVEVTLAPGESRPVQTQLTIAADAEPGEYAALIGPQIISGSGGAQVGAAAAARLTFHVEASSIVEAWLRQAFRFLAEDPVVVVIAGALVALLVIRFLRRRLTITVARRP